MQHFVKLVCCIAAKLCKCELELRVYTIVYLLNARTPLGGRGNMAGELLITNFNSSLTDSHSQTSEYRRLATPVLSFNFPVQSVFSQAHHCICISKSFLPLGRFQAKPREFRKTAENRHDGFEIFPSVRFGSVFWKPKPNRLSVFRTALTETHVFVVGESSGPITDTDWQW